MLSGRPRIFNPAFFEVGDVVLTRSGRQARVTGFVKDAAGRTEGVSIRCLDNADEMTLLPALLSLVRRAKRVTGMRFFSEGLA